MRPNQTPKYYIIEVTNRNTSMSETYYITDPATTSTNINYLHPYHLYQFSIAAFTVTKGPSESQTLQMLQAGMNTIVIKA